MIAGTVRRRPEAWTRRYPPLVLLAAALVLAVLTLPSSLNLPQASPAQTVQYAPVPPNGNAPPGGNLSSLGLGSSSTLGANGAGGFLGSPPGRGANPTQKRCVGNPPRQTEDPVSPPCVPYFTGDNGGATYAGVTRSEIRVLYYFDSANAGGTSNGGDTHPPDSYWDLWSAPQSSDPVFVRLLRDLEVYFNSRYQTYGRSVHLIVHFGRQYPASAVSRGQDAEEDLAKVHPYAVVASVSAFLENYIRPMTARGVTVFLGNPAAGAFGSTLETASFYRAAPGQVWSYFPDVEHLARLYSSYVCTKVLGHQVSFSGSPAMNRSPRVLGLWKSGDPSHPELVRFGDLVQSQVQACGGQFRQVGSSPVYNGDNGGPNDQDAAGNCSNASASWAGFESARVTTIIWTAGSTGPCELSFAASSGYYPELVIAGEGLADTNLAASILGPASEMANARTVSTFVAVARVADQPCYQALYSVDPTLSPVDAKGYGCAFYPDLRELFTGIQVAGPHLDPLHVDQGYHAIPPLASRDPRVPTCFYDPGDYSCVKDTQAEWWDPSGRPDTEGPSGCWRMMQAGLRHEAGAWPSGDVDAQKTNADPCNFNGLNVT